MNSTGRTDQSLQHEAVKKSADGQIIEITTRARVINRHGKSLMILYDREREHPLLCRLVADYDQQIRSTLNQLQMGNRVTASLKREPDEKPFRIERIRRESTETLLFIQNPDELPGDPRTAWENRDEGENVGVKYEPRPTESGYEVVREVHAHTNAIGEGLDLWEVLKLGTYPVEHWYEDPLYLSDPTSDIIATNPQNQPFVVVYLFSEGGTEEYREFASELGVSNEILAHMSGG